MPFLCAEPAHDRRLQVRPLTCENADHGLSSLALIRADSGETPVKPIRIRGYSSFGLRGCRPDPFGSGSVVRRVRAPLASPWLPGHDDPEARFSGIWHFPDSLSMVPSVAARTTRTLATCARSCGWWQPASDVNRAPERGPACRGPITRVGRLSRPTVMPGPRFGAGCRSSSVTCRGSEGPIANAMSCQGGCLAEERVSSPDRGSGTTSTGTSCAARMPLRRFRRITVLFGRERGLSFGMGRRWSRGGSGGPQAPQTPPPGARPWVLPLLTVHKLSAGGTGD